MNFVPSGTGRGLNPLLIPNFCSSASSTDSAGAAISNFGVAVLTYPTGRTACVCPTIGSLGTCRSETVPGSPHDSQTRRLHN
jgi:hypothetical protein